jgi:hypothetical protein
VARSLAAEIENLYGVGVLELAGSIELLLKTLKYDRIRGKLGAEDLEGNDIPGALVSPLVDFSHASLAHALEDLVVGYLF